MSALSTDAPKLIREALVPHFATTHIEHEWGYTALKEGVREEDLTGCVSLLGAFDGFHKGHATLMDSALTEAMRTNKQVVALTFWPDPSEVLGYAEGRLMDECQRVNALLGAGASAVCVLRFDAKFAALSPAAFCELLAELLRPSQVHVGEFFHFGAQGQGTTDDLKTLCAVHGITVMVHKKLQIGGACVSATRIRKLVREGKLEDAWALMNRYLCFPGTIAHGRGEGTGLGFATANLMVEPQRLLLAPGVYAGYTVVDNMAWPTAANAGAPASFGGGDDNLIEAHLLGFTGDIYDKSASFVPLVMLRPEIQFASTEELMKTVQSNIAWVKTHVGTEGLEV